MGQLIKLKAQQAWRQEESQTQGNLAAVMARIKQELRNVRERVGDIDEEDLTAALVQSIEVLEGLDVVSPYLNSRYLKTFEPLFGSIAEFVIVSVLREKLQEKIAEFRVIRPNLGKLSLPRDLGHMLRDTLSRGADEELQEAVDLNEVAGAFLSGKTNKFGERLSTVLAGNWRAMEHGLRECIGGLEHWCTGTVRLQGLGAIIGHHE